MDSEDNKFTSIYECVKCFCQYMHKQAFTASAKTIETPKEAVDKSVLLETGRQELKLFFTRTWMEFRRLKISTSWIRTTSSHSYVTNWDRYTISSNCSVITIIMRNLGTKKKEKNQERSGTHTYYPRLVQ